MTSSGQALSNEQAWARWFQEFHEPGLRLIEFSYVQRLLEMNVESVDYCDTQTPGISPVARNRHENHVLVERDCSQPVPGLELPQGKPQTCRQS